MQEIMIPIIGASGAGKSTFLNYLVQDERQKSKVGHDLTSCTSELHPITLTFPNDPFLQCYKVTLIDTPGFDDTYVGDAAILQRIADWLENAYRQNKVLGGVIYLHDISSDRFSGTARKNLEMFNRMCGDAALDKVIIGTTKWRRTPLDIGAKHEDELNKIHWRSMLEKGAKTKRFEDSYDSALSFIRRIVGGDSRPDIIIPVMGSVGAGKSTFINYLVQDERLRCKVAAGSAPCTSDLHPVPLHFPNDPILQQYTVILVDTPGFDDTHVGHADMLRRIADWFEKVYREKGNLGGVIYLHDIGGARLTGSARRDLEMFQSLCGEAAFRKVIIGTTRWSKPTQQREEKHETELEKGHWSSMLAKGARTKRFDDSYDSALSFVKDIVRDMLLKVYLQIQTEIVDDKKIIPETKAGKELRSTLIKEVLEEQKKLAEFEKRKGEGGRDDEIARKHKAAQDKMDALIGQIQQLKVPFSRKLRKFFGFF